MRKPKVIINDPLSAKIPVNPGTRHFWNGDYEAVCKLADMLPMALAHYPEMFGSDSVDHLWANLRKHKVKKNNINDRAWFIAEAAKGAESLGMNVPPLWQEIRALWDFLATYADRAPKYGSTP